MVADAIAGFAEGLSTLTLCAPDLLATGANKPNIVGRLLAAGENRGRCGEFEVPISVAAS
jgi:hypothetical protein